MMVVHNTQELVINKAMDWGLDWTIDATEPFTDQDFLDELQGLSDGSGVPLQMIKRIHAIPDATKGDCSMFGAWGSALQDPNGEMSQ